MTAVTDRGSLDGSKPASASRKPFQPASTNQQNPEAWKDSITKKMAEAVEIMKAKKIRPNGENNG